MQEILHVNPWWLSWTLDSPARRTAALERASGEEGECGWIRTDGGETCPDSGPASAGWEGEDFWLLRGATTAPSKVMVYSWCLSLGGEPLFYLFDKVLSPLGHINSSYRYERALLGAPE